jgi:polysaccharide biosynthesis protein PslE
MSSPESWTLIDYIAALWRFKWRALAVCLLAIGAGVAFIVYMPKKYESEAKLFVRVGRENATLDPTVIKGDQIAVASSQSRETEINSIVEHLKSRGILQKALDKIYTRNPNESDLERERAYAKLKSRVQVSSPRQSTIVQLTAKADTPEEAQQIAAAIVEIYLDEHLRVSRPNGSLAFLSEQAAQMRAEYDQALKELRDAKNRGGMASIEGRRKALEDQISAVESQLHNTEAEHAAASARLKSKRNSIENLPKPLLKQMVGGMPNDGLAQMRDRLFQLQVQQEELRSKFSDSHPNVVSVNKQVVELTDILNREDPEREQIIKTLCAEEEARDAALTAQDKSLRGQLADLQKSLAALNEDEIAVTQTALKVRQLETKYMTYAANSEDARIDEALRDDKISNLSVIQAATLSPLAVFPQKASTLLIAGFAGMVGGILLALISEQLRRIRLAQEHDAGHADILIQHIGIAETPDYAQELVVGRTPATLHTKSL